MKKLTNNFSSSYFLNKRGNLLIVLPISFALLAAAFGISAFMNLSNFTLKRVLIKQNAHGLSEKIRARVRELIQTNQSCGGYDFSLLKDAGNPPVPPFVFDKLKLVPCFLTQEEASFFKTINFTITRVSRAKDSDIAQTMIETQFKYETASSPVFFESINRQILVSLVTPLSFVSIFRGNKTSISLSLKSSVVFSGKTLFLNGKETGLDLDNFVNPRLFENKEGYVLFEDVVYQTGKGIAVNKFFNTDSLQFFFREGIQENSFNGADTVFVSSSSDPYWNQPLDYYYVYDDEGGFPLPANILNAAMGPFAFKPVDVNRAKINKFPDGVVLKKLSQTCELSASSSEGSVKPMVYLNKAKDLSLDFKDSNIFCGLIVANVLNIKIPENVEAAIYGHINVSRLNIIGGGKLYVVNPYDFKSSPQKAILPSAASIQSLIPTLDSLKTTVAHNFYIPIGNPPPLFAPELVNTHFESCGSSMCWKSYIESSDITKLYVPNWYKSLKMMVTEAL